jgi:hypothetical protein
MKWLTVIVVAALLSAIFITALAVSTKMKGAAMELESTPRLMRQVSRQGHPASGRWIGQIN